MKFLPEALRRDPVKLAIALMVSLLISAIAIMNR